MDWHLSIDNWVPCSGMLFTLWIKRELYEVKSGRLWWLILVQNYIDELRIAKKVDKNFKVFEENSIFEPPTIYSLHRYES